MGIKALRDSFLTAIFLLGMLLLACKAPQVLAEQWWARFEGTPSSTSVLNGAVYPSQIVEEYPMNPTLEAVEETTSLQGKTAYPESGQEPEPSRETPQLATDTEQVINASESAYPLVVPSDSPYPLAVPSNSPYPGITLASTPGSPYPGIATATLTAQSSITPGMSPTATQTAPQTSASTFTPSPTPTATRTPIPPPPWLQSELKASDPRQFRLDSGKVQLVMFFAFWSGVSQAMAPIVHGIEAIYQERVDFVYLDIDDPATRPIQEMLYFETAPHFFLLDEEGKVVKSWQGYVTAEELIASIEAVLGL